MSLGLNMSTKPQKKVVVLHSGGLDSTVCLLLAISRGYKVLSLGVNYNQHHVIELDYAAKQCERFGIDRKVISVTWCRRRFNIDHLCRLNIDQGL